MIAAMSGKHAAIAALALAVVGGGAAWFVLGQEPEPEPEPEVVEAQPMSEKEQIELMMRIGYIQQEDLDELPDEDPPSE